MNKIFIKVAVAVVLVIIVAVIAQVYARKAVTTPVDGIVPTESVQAQ